MQFVSGFSKEAISDVDPALSDISISRDRPMKERQYLKKLWDELGRRRMNGEKLTSSKVSGGGVLLAIKDNMLSQENMPKNRSVECGFATVKLSSIHRMLVGGVYLPPNMPSSQYFDFASIVEELLLTSKNFEPILLLGDFNLPNADWDPFGSQIKNISNIKTKRLSEVKIEFYN
ncbi:hypothetical protein J6590_068203 [Homalodisca vitripennis]|nr:hypothetical protein J6590_068203 [Homalodisca vitripennis]